MTTTPPAPTVSGSKIYPASVRNRSYVLIGIALVMWLVSLRVQALILPAREKMQETKDATKVIGGLNNEFLLLPLLGFREAAAGLLWVRCDQFFDSGDYDAILPLVRVITWLDPHDSNVYVTGAWHMAYNFTDSQERSDRRYIYPSQALLTEGIQNNMLIPDVKFEKGWENFDKIKNFPEAAAAFQLTIDTRPNKNRDDWPQGAPLKTWHILAHTYEKMGRIPDAINVWHEAMAISASRIKDHGGKTKDFSDWMLSQAETHNLQEEYQRFHDRYTAAGHDHVNPSKYPGVQFPFGGSNKPGPWNVHISNKITVVRPKVLQFTGTFNSADGARVDVLIEDWDYKPHIDKNSATAFAVDPNQTILMDSIAVRKDTYDRQMDMSKDPKMYSFAHSYYRIVVSYDPRTTAPTMQDRFGWSGEGMTDDNPNRLIVDTTPGQLANKYIDGFGATGPIWDPTIAPWPQYTQPKRMLMITYKVSRDQMLGQSPITDANIVSNKIMALGPGMLP